MKKNNILALLFPFVALILEFLPNGVAMHFMAPPGEEPFVTMTSYADLLALGYGNFGPFLTIVLTLVLINIIFLYIFKNNSKFLGRAKIISLVAFIMSLVPIVFNSYTIIGGLISISLFIEFIYLAFNKNLDIK